MEAHRTNRDWTQVEIVAPKARVLIVDDTEFNLKMERTMLVKLKVAADTALSGQDAIELVKKNRYDLILMDYLMPEMDGVETTRRIRELFEGAENREYYESVPILALTGDNSEDVRALFQQAGIQDCVEKPVNKQKLKEILIRWLPAKLIEEA